MSMIFKKTLFSLLMLTIPSIIMCHEKTFVNQTDYPVDVTLVEAYGDNENETTMAGETHKETLSPGAIKIISYNKKHLYMVSFFVSITGVKTVYKSLFRNDEIDKYSKFAIVPVPVKPARTTNINIEKS